ncbi:hypothetical protein BBBOND_0200520 [Babesia bigemina]|uniref:Uncharacterized protein n=1 Tax=Babesia bigemina TaxID=5866 RepID=A0A061DAZ8_BABBI|nr:hypothetical protein BBBOND_0200520 [Babesia bigemina]CDR94895.1 hypothetical protein BBBOND_0200520 [Babesia bigemina]|eukprot:XP_012767081.1 hypothetical protein BBBOND_0200520 [Babesia bigemina]
MVTIWNGQECTKCGNKCRRAQECNCCPWCCYECNKAGVENCDVCWYHIWKRKGGSMRYDCRNFGCETKCAGKEHTCQCTCCRAKCQVPGACSPPAPRPPVPSPGAERQTSERRLTDSSTEESSARSSDAETSTPPPPDPQAIAAVIVAIIVAIVLLDLCIFRFPVGRNIRDFLVRKIPFCIAFYS